MTKEQFMLNHSSISKEDAIAFLQEHSNEDLPNNYLSRAFECIFIDKTTGTTSRPITIAELMELHPSYGLGNGNGWGRAGVCFLMNYHTMNYYRGCNLITLEAGEYITYNQLQNYKAGLPVDEAEKIKIRKGATTEQVFFFQVKDKIDEDGNIVYKEGTDKPDKTFIFRYYNVYNIKDIEGFTGFVFRNVPSFQICIFDFD